MFLYTGTDREVAITDTLETPTVSSAIQWEGKVDPRFEEDERAERVMSED